MLLYMLHGTYTGDACSSLAAHQKKNKFLGVFAD